jgi:dTDP-4-dehydrorhamnose reductase
MAGHMACRVLAEEHVVHATVRGTHAEPRGLAAILPRARCAERFDPTAAGAVPGLLAALRPEVVVNCVGLIKQKPECADPVQAFRINALLPHELAAACGAAGAKLITIGTDCVFSGRRGAYAEDDVPDPVDLYGRSKLAGEVVAAPHLTLRTSLLGRQLRGSEGLLEWLLARRGGRVRGWTRAVFSGVTTATLGKALLAIMRSRPDLSGLYHLAAAPISKYELLRRIDRAMGLRISIEEEHEIACDRSLLGTRLSLACGYRPPEWDEMVAGLAADAGDYDTWRDGV